MLPKTFNWITSIR